MELFSIRIQRTFQLVSTSHKGAERGAILYTIALTCRMNKVNLFEYLTHKQNCRMATEYTTGKIQATASRQMGKG